MMNLKRTVAIIPLANSAATKSRIRGQALLDLLLSTLSLVQSIGDIIVAPQIPIKLSFDSAVAGKAKVGPVRKFRLAAIQEALRMTVPSAQVLIHDTEYPLAPSAAVETLLAELAERPGAVGGIPVTAAYKQVTGGFVQRTVPRSELVRITGLRAFQWSALEELITTPDEAVDDEVQAARHAGLPLRISWLPRNIMRVIDQGDADIAAAMLGS